ncbi:lipopolysaccharide biosynthesis protein [Rhodococcus opacus]|uniref:lipopolysaccharide biosynthesis protein n=1 Tax=Rhodococcus opacus TaxID=37919 RepID=UPI001C443D7A|nr:hypothetical protein [Rhodococcus opacus]MBV6760646.1 hypothetical protein [Rhodococcus opacus]
MVVGLGIPLAIRHRASIDKSDRIVRASYVILPFLAPAALFLGVISTWTAVDYLSSTATIIFLGGATATTLFVGTLCFQSVLIAEQRYGAVALLQSVQVSTSTIGVLIGGVTHQLSFDWLLVWGFAGTVTSFFVGAAQVGVSPIGPRTDPIALARDGVTFAGGQIADIASLSIIQILAVKAVGASNAGYYAVAAQVAGLVVIAGYTIGAAAFRTIASASDETRPQKISSVIRSTILCSGLLSIILALIAPMLIPLAFGAESSPAVLPTLVSLTGATSMTLNYVCGQLLVATGKGGLMTLAQISGIVASILMLFVFAQFGAIGASTAVGTGVALTTIVSLYGLRVSIRQILPRAGDFRDAIGLATRGKL